MATTEDVLEGADVVALCASTDPGRPTILDAALLQRVRAGSFVVNVGRAALVDAHAVVAAIRSGHLRGYAVDDIVLDPVEHADLLTEGRVLQTAHSAWWRDEVLERGAEHFGRAILAAVLGTPVDLVTPSAPAAKAVAAPGRRAG